MSFKNRYIGVLSGLVTMALMLSGASQARAGERLLLQGQIFSTKNFVGPHFVGDADTKQDFILQFKGRITEPMKTKLRAAGIQVFKYIPDDALIVQSTAPQMQKFVSSTDQVQAWFPMRGALKLSANIEQRSVFNRDSIQNYVVTLLDAGQTPQVLRSIQKVAADTRLVAVDGRFLTMSLSNADLSDIAEITGVEFIELVSPIEPFHVKFEDEQDSETAGNGTYSDLDGYETGTKIMNFESAWTAGYTGKGQVAGMGDTGLDTGVVGKLASDFQTAVTQGFFYGIGASDWSDPMGHGTHVAGSIVSRGTASGGLLKGGAYDAGFVPGGLWSPILSNLSVPPKLSKMFADAQSQGARIHSNSWGSARSFGAYDSMAIQVDEFMFNNPNFLVLFAAGNSGTDKNADGVIDPGSMASPATAKNTLTVGASEGLNSKGGIQKFIKELRTAATSWPAEPIATSKLSDNANGLAMFSSRGPTSDGRIKPDIVAPGTNILSNRSHVPGADPMWGAYNDDYTYAGGTSMATPLTAGAATVVRQILQEKFSFADPSAALMKAYLMHTATDLYPGQYGEGSATQEIKTRRPNSDQGYGRVNMETATHLSSVTLIDETRGLATGEVFSKIVEVPEGGTLVANLVYTDAPGTSVAGKALVNNLDLAVLSHDLEITSADDTNNHELFERSGLAAGKYRIEIRGTNVPMGRSGAQPFALVYSVR